MPSLIKAMLLAVHTVILAAILGVPSTILPTLASPLPMPSANHLSHKSDSAQAQHSMISDSSLAAHETIKPVRTVSAPHSNPSRPSRSVGYALARSKPRRVGRRDLLELLVGYYHGAYDNAHDFKKYAAQSSSRKYQNDDTFHQLCLTSLQGFSTNILGIQTLLEQLGADRGLANYDPNNKLETTLKDLVNLNKNFLKDVDRLVYNIPGLGPTIEPLVYNLKCILDAILNATENISDALLNALDPLLAPLLKGLVRRV